MLVNIVIRYLYRTYIFILKYFNIFLINNKKKKHKLKTKKETIPIHQKKENVIIQRKKKKTNFRVESVPAVRLALIYTADEIKYSNIIVRSANHRRTCSNFNKVLAKLFIRYRL